MKQPAETGVAARGGQQRRGAGKGSSTGGGSTAAGQDAARPGAMRASLAAQRQLSRFLLLLIAAVWFGLLFVGCADYQGHPPRVNSRELPLYWFDVAFRRFGSLMLPALWAARTASTLLAPEAMAAARARVWVPGALYAGQAALRAVLYALHYYGWLFPPSVKELNRPVGEHPPHVMSDHILLAATLVAGAACEAVMPLLAWRHDSKTGRLSWLAAAHSAAAVALAVLLSAESYTTARYFHPPGEILYAAGLGLLVFQAPAAIYARSAIAEAQQQAAVEREARRAERRG